MTEVSIGSVIRVKDIGPDFLRWCRTELVVNNPEYIRKASMGFWLGQTPKVLSLFEIDGLDVIIPYGAIDFIPKFATKKAKVTREFHKDQKVNYKADIPLYAYQNDAVMQMLKAKHGILVSPAGSGKTRMGISLFTQMGLRTLWLCNKIDLVEQARDACLEFVDKRLVGTIKSGTIEVGTGVTFATVQTMANIDLQRYRDTWDVIIVDECHGVAGTATALTMYKKVLDNLNAKHKFGLSATMHRGDGLLKSTFMQLGKVVHEVMLSEVKDTVLPVGIKPIPTGIGLSPDMVGTDGMINYQKMITSLVNNDIRNNLIRDKLIECGDRHVLVLSERVAHLETMIESLPPELREKAYIVRGKSVKTSYKEKCSRKAIYQALRTTKTGYLFATYQLAKEGLNIPRLNTVLFTTPQKDYMVITQALGRVARTNKGKKDAICYDFIDSFPTAEKAYKARTRSYKKNECYYIE